MKIINVSELTKVTKYDLIINLTNKKYKLKKVYNYSNLNDLCSYLLKSKFNNIAVVGDKNIDEVKYLVSFLEFYNKHYAKLKANQTKINDELIKQNDNNIVKNVITDFIDLNQDGKYIRGVLIALGEYLATNKEKLTYLNLAYAFEMFQTSVLIHDDIIDNADLRRGKTTIPKRIYDRYINKIAKKDVINLSNSVGICAGDFGFFEANKLLISYSKNKNFAKLMETYNDTIIKTIKGEIIDVCLPVLGKYKIYDTEEQDILDIYQLKTSWYTIIGPFTLGYILGGKSINKNLEKVLNNIGISFQLKDDILGIFADSKVIGKSNVSDIEEFKQTLLYTHIVNTKYKNKFLKIYGKNKVSKKDLLKIRKLLILAGSYEYAINYLNDLYEDTIKAIDKLTIKDSGKNILKGLLIYINIREK